MNEFLEKLYSYEYFGTYLMIAIVVLLLLFVIVLFFGKKDQKHREIEATKKLQQINTEDAFKEESKATSVNVEEKPKVEDVPSIQNVIDSPVELVSSQTEEVMSSVAPSNVSTEPILTDESLERTIIVPNISEISVNKEEPKGNEIEEKSNIEEPIIVSNKETIDNLNDNITLENPSNIDLNIMPNMFNEVEIPTEIPQIEELEKIEDLPNVALNKEVVLENKEKPILFEATPNNETSYTFKPSENSIEIPKINIEKREENKEVPFKNSEVFSSVYVQDKESKPEENMESSIPTSDELDIELPALKKEAEEVKEEKIELPELNDYDLDNITGESYTINN